MSHIGWVTSPHESSKGLEVEYELDVDRNQFAKQVAVLLSERRVREHSFAYDIMPGGARIASDGANDLTELDLIEVGPTLKGANPATEMLDVRSASGPVRPHTPGGSSQEKRAGRHQSASR